MLLAARRTKVIAAAQQHGIAAGKNRITRHSARGVPSGKHEGSPGSLAEALQYRSC